jgi:hypothetical protein
MTGNGCTGQIERKALGSPFVDENKARKRPGSRMLSQFPSAKSLYLSEDFFGPFGSAKNDAGVFGGGAGWRMDRLDAGIIRPRDGDAPSLLDRRTFRRMSHEPADHATRRARDSR